MQWVDVLGAARRERRHELGAASRLGAGNTTVAGGEEDGNAEGADRGVRVAELGSERARHGVLVLAVRSRQDVGDRVLLRDEVDGVEEALEATVLVVVADGEEVDRDAGGDADSVLHVEVGLNAGLAGALRVRATIDGLELEGRGGRL
jgi:hypothetical protein